VLLQELVERLGRPRHQIKQQLHMLRSKCSAPTMPSSRAFFSESSDPEAPQSRSNHHRGVS